MLDVNFKIWILNENYLMCILNKNNKKWNIKKHTVKSQHTQDSQRFWTCKEICFCSLNFLGSNLISIGSNMIWNCVFSCADFVMGSGWSSRFATLTNRKLFGLKVIPVLLYSVNSKRTLFLAKLLSICSLYEMVDLGESKPNCHWSMQ